MNEELKVKRMKKILFVIFATLTLSGFSQNNFEINFERGVTASQLDQSDSLFSDKAEIKIFVTGAANSVELKLYDFSNNAFSEVHSSTITVGSLSDTPCASNYCSYKLNPNVLIIDLGSHSATSGKYKVYIKINGAPGKGELVKEVEL